MICLWSSWAVGWITGCFDFSMYETAFASLAYCLITHWQIVLIECTVSDMVVWKGCWSVYVINSLFKINSLWTVFTEIYSWKGFFSFPFDRSAYPTCAYQWIRFDTSSFNNVFMVSSVSAIINSSYICDFSQLVIFSIRSK